MYDEGEQGMNKILPKSLKLINPATGRDPTDIKLKQKREEDIISERSDEDDTSSNRGSQAKSGD